VKNFQLTTERDSKLARPTVQFGKVQSDLFTLDYVGPISALEAFMLSLASCDNKLACG
jgi:tubby-related protein 1